MNDKSNMSLKIMFSIRSIIVALASGVILVGCAKIPDRLVSPMIKIEPAVVENKEAYKIMVSTGIQNENSDVALVNVKGNINFYDHRSDGTALLSVPFDFLIVLPFDTGIIEIEKFYSENEIMPLVAALGSNKEKLLSEKGLERSFIDDTNIRLELSSYEKKHILDVLKERVNEKN